MIVDPSDGLPLADVGSWALEKHERLRKYIDIARATRWKYVDPSRPANYRGGATYIDIFCGPGRARVEGGCEIIDGSPLVAFKAAREGKAPFSDLHLADINGDFAEASAKRIAALGGAATIYVGRAEDTARSIVQRISPYGLHLAFLDPFNLAGLSFDVIRTLAVAKHMDILMHVSVQDMQRNADRYTSEDATAFDAFAPGWREKVDLNQSLNGIRASVLAYWESLVIDLGFLGVRSVELVRGSKNQRLYWLAFVSRHRIANEFWDKVRNVSGQKGWNF